MLTWLYLHFPSLQLDAIQAQKTAEQNDDSHQTPLIVLDPKQNQVCQLNQSAFEQGIRLNMGMATAASLCADLSLVAYQPHIDETRLKELAQWLYQHIADIVICPPKGLALKVSNMLSLYGSFEHYWQQVVSVLIQQQVTFSAALAHNIDAAQLLAKSGQCPLSHDPNEVSRQLECLLVEQLPLAATHVEQLHRIGIKTLGQLLAIDRRSLGKRFGLEVLSTIEAIKRKQQRPVVFYQPPEHYSQYLELFHEVAQAQVLLFPLKRMVKHMSLFLQKRDQEIAELTLTLHHRDKQLHPDTSIIIGSSGGEYRFDQWMTLIGLKVERLNLAAPVVGLTISSGQMLDKQCHNTELLTSSNSKMSNNQLISRLQAKVGKAHICAMTLQADHRPEFAFDYTSELKPQTPEPQPLPGPRPLILLPEAKPVTQKYQLLHGPERIRSAWWSDNAVYRDYFIARDPHGAICWLYNEPGGSWFLQGYFC